MSVKKYNVNKVGSRNVSNHFTYSEFASPDTNILKLDGMLPKYLEALIYKLGAKKAVITSGYRTPEYSVSVGGTKNDKHTQGMAADVIFYNSDNEVISPADVCCTAEDLGFIGGVAKIGNTATHIDTRSIDSKYWGDESTGSYSSIWNQKQGYTSFYKWFGKTAPAQRTIKYKTKKLTPYRIAPFKSAKRMGTLKKGTVVKVIRGGRVEYNNVTFYQCKINGILRWINKKYLVKA